MFTNLKISLQLKGIFTNLKISLYLIKGSVQQFENISLLNERECLAIWKYLSTIKWSVQQFENISLQLKGVFSNLKYLSTIKGSVQQFEISLYNYRECSPIWKYLSTIKESVHQFKNISLQLKGVFTNLKISLYS